MKNRKQAPFHIGLLAALLLALSSALALAQSGKWESVTDKSKARLKFDAPGLAALPDRLDEYMPAPGERIQGRQMRYVFGNLNSGAPFAILSVSEAQSQYQFFDSAPPFERMLDSIFPPDRGPPRSYSDNTFVPAEAPIGQTPFRRFHIGQRSCMVFGSNYGRTAGHRLRDGGVPVGTIQLFGIYCAAARHDLRQTDARLVLSRLSYDVLGQANGPQPQGF